MEHLDVFFMMVGVAYSCWLVLKTLIRFDYEVSRRHRRRRRNAPQHG